jgi:hypothetical protein
MAFLMNAAKFGTVTRWVQSGGYDLSTIAEDYVIVRRDELSRATLFWPTTTSSCSGREIVRSPSRAWAFRAYVNE